eukprot:TRINITY_DN67760_c7_g1_i1.p3 TRINITY_DN67760_c7_g1~~TRINITY_DN67760_c7_g1_i1.p3  ORF type:complete len:132 (-),score=74.71 TRINITY_DN67760_c7_g1_i1:619-1014(-)
MVQRLTYSRRHSYNTKSNAIREVKTPGGKLVAQYVSKRANGPKCGGCGKRLQGIAALRPKQYRAVTKRQRTVSRAYGGSECASCVRERIVRAFLVEEQRIVKQVLKAREQSNKAKKSKKSKKGKKGKKGRK